jgi:hypothetical protein
MSHPVKLVAVSMVKNEEYWIWYSLTSVAPHVDEILLFDNYSEDSTLDVVRGMDHLGDRLLVWDEFGGQSEQENREHILDIARCRGATHLLFLDGDEVHTAECLGFCRRLLEAQEHTPPLHDPPANHMRPRDHTPTDGVLIKNIGFKPIHPGFAGPDTCRPQDLMQSDTDHGCYNFAIRIASVQNLRGNGLEWGQHGFLETNDLYMQSSPHTLWLPRIWYYHFSWHPRSSVRRDAKGYAHAVRDFGSVPLPAHVHLPEVLLHPDGPSNPTLERWGIAACGRGNACPRAVADQTAG